MNLLALAMKAPTAWRDTLAVEDAVKHRDGAHVAAALTALFVFIVNYLQGTPYAPYVSFITPAMATQLGLLVGGALVSWGHWTTAGVLAAVAGAKPVDGRAADAPAAVAGPRGDAVAGGVAQPAAPVGRGAADTVAPGAVRSEPEAAGPTGNFMP